jgi:hypothetical protein
MKLKQFAGKYRTVKMFWKILSQNWIKIGNHRQLDTAFIAGFQETK